LIVLVKSSETPGVELVEKALANYREFIQKWHTLQDEQATKDHADEKPAAQGS
jgi:hypothetical protein